MIISFSGMAGAGKSTVAELLSKKLGIKRYYIGGMRRDMAKKRGMTLEEYNKLGETDISTDKEVDLFQEELGKKEDDFIIEGRTSFHFIPHSIKIFLDVDPYIGAKRIFSAKNQKASRNESESASIEELMIKNKERADCDRKRYKKYYGISDCYDKHNFDYVLDTTNLSPNEIVLKIIYYLEKCKYI
jgi:cytidylate kinase